MKIIFATTNRGKLREASEILGPGFTLVSPAELDIFDDVPETGDSFAANSMQKAAFLFNKCAIPCFADDSGLEVDALGGAPGIYTGRYADQAWEEELAAGVAQVEKGAPNHHFDAGIRKLLREMAALPEGTPRTARFRCVTTLILDEGTKVQFEGSVEGKIAPQRSGEGGFGYDPVFVPDAFPDKTLSELGEDVKNSISHRGEALRKMAAWLREHNIR